MAEQNFENHGKFVPAFHFFVIPMVAINLGWQVYRWKRSEFTVGGFESILLAAALLLGFFYARLFALRVQDRVIRLEEQLRCQRLLPADLQPRIAEFSAGQLIALRFASDAELPALARKVLDEKLTERKAIKQLIKNWKPDYLRA
jgi:uncharacterized membrane protein YciS (DUF1049 family)